MKISTSTGENAAAQIPEELCTVEQYATIKNLAVDLNVDIDQAIKSLFQIPVEELSKAGARDVIDYLKNLKRKIKRMFFAARSNQIDF